MIFKSPEFHQVPLNRGKKSSSLVLPYYVPVSISTYTCDKDKIDTGYESSMTRLHSQSSAAGNLAKS